MFFLIMINGFYVKDLLTPKIKLYEFSLYKQNTNFIVRIHNIV